MNIILSLKTPDAWIISKHGHHDSRHIVTHEARQCLVDSSRRVPSVGPSVGQSVGPRHWGWLFMRCSPGIVIFEIAGLLVYIRNLHTKICTSAQAQLFFLSGEIGSILVDCF